MSQFNEVAEPIICDAYAEPTHHWVIEAREYLPDFLARLQKDGKEIRKGRRVAGRRRSTPRGPRDVEPTA